MTVRYLAVRAGPFRLGLPLEAVRQILDAGGEQAQAPSDPRALGVLPLSLAELLGAEPLERRPALLLFDGHTGPVLLSTCVLGAVVDAPPPRPLPRTVACRWPGLIRGVIDDDDATAIDTSALDTGAVDTGARDTGAVDTGARDTGARDTGAVDASAIDAGDVDGGAAVARPRRRRLRLVLDPRVLMGLVEAAGEAPQEGAP